MFFIFSTPVLIKHLWRLKTIVFLHCLIHAVPLQNSFVRASFILDIWIGNHWTHYLNRATHNRHWCSKTNIFYHPRYLINTVVEKMNNVSLYIRTLTTSYLKVRVNVCIQTIVNIFWSVLFHLLIPSMFLLIFINLQM